MHAVIKTSAFLLALMLLPMGSLLASENDSKDRIEIKGDQVINLDLSPELNLDDARQVIVRTLTNRRWQIVEEDKDAGVIVANLVHRRHDSTLYLVYSTDNLTIYSDSWRINRSRERTGRDHPTGWIENIEKDVKVFWQQASADL